MLIIIYLFAQNSIFELIKNEIVRSMKVFLRKTGLTDQERQLLLIKASKDYMRGSISRREFQKVEREYRVDYGSVTLELAGQGGILPRLFKSVKSKFHNLCCDSNSKARS